MLLLPLLLLQMKLLGFLRSLLVDYQLLVLLILQPRLLHLFPPNCRARYARCPGNQISLADFITTSTTGSNRSGLRRSCTRPRARVR